MTSEVDLLRSYCEGLYSTNMPALYHSYLTATNRLIMTNTSMGSEAKARTAAVFNGAAASFALWDMK